jgi:hypothetical protein
MLVNKKRIGRDALRLVWGTGGTGDILVGEKDSVSTRMGVGTRRGARRLSSVDHHQTLYWLRFFLLFWDVVRRSSRPGCIPLSDTCAKHTGLIRRMLILLGEEVPAGIAGLWTGTSWKLPSPR